MRVVPPFPYANDEELRKKAWYDLIRQIAQDYSLNSSVGLKNVIIGGDFETNPWQRGTSFAAVATNSYLADRWRYLKSGAMVHTVTRSTDVPIGSYTLYSMRVDCTTVDTSLAAGDFCTVRQVVEGTLLQGLLDKPSVISFWVKATKTGPSYVAVRSLSGSEGIFLRYNINSSNTWEKKELTVNSFAGSAGSWYQGSLGGAIIDFPLCAGSTYHTTLVNQWSGSNTPLCGSDQVNHCDSTANDFFLAQVQWERGGNATYFERRDPGTERMLCQRYFQRHNYAPLVGVSSGAGVVERLRMIFPTEMRAAPTVTMIGTPKIVDGVATGSITSINTNYTTAQAAELTLNSSISTAGRPAVLYNDGSGWAFDFLAEV